MQMGEWFPVATLRDQILNAKDYKSKKVKVEEWGGVEVEVRSMSAAARSRIIEMGDNMNVAELSVALVLECVYDPKTGERVFSPADKEVLMQKNAGVLERLAREINEVSGFTDEDVEQAEKN